MCDCYIETGDCVVCVDDSTSLMFGTPMPISRGQVYNVSGTLHKGELWRGQEVNGCGLFLAGVTNFNEGRIVGEYICNGAYSHKRFRRVYRPNGSLISKLLEPVDLEVRIGA